MLAQRDFYDRSAYRDAGELEHLFYRSIASLSVLVSGPELSGEVVQTYARSDWIEPKALNEVGSQQFGLSERSQLVGEFIENSLGLSQLGHLFRFWPRPVSQFM
jgi:hypothetical protein